MDRRRGTRFTAFGIFMGLGLLAVGASGCGSAQPLADDAGDAPDDGGDGEACGCTTDQDCDNGVFCDGIERCSDCRCMPGTPPACDDGVACTNDSCSESMERCQSVPDHGRCGATELCDAVEGCRPAPECAADPACDDGLWCNGAETCDAVALRCRGGTPPDCADVFACTADECNEDADTCQPVAADSFCEDGDLCTVDRCDPEDPGADERGCLPPAGGCDDGDPCTDDFCDLERGCFHSFNAAPCDDGDACTVGDRCDAGACVGTEERSCDDDNPCTDDACNPAGGCNHAYNTGACDDGSACTTVDVCDGSGTCVGSGGPDCDDGDPCTDDSCDPAGGCTHANNTAPCDDGDLCTEDDVCSDGACGGAALTCTDGNSCTDDSCNPASGCVFTNNASACDDADPCTSGDACSGGSCRPGATLPTWYRDADGDAYGDATVTTCAAAAPSGYVADATDCCDSAAAAHPAQTTWFAASYSCGAGPSYDYDCSGAAERRWTTTGGGCSTSGGSCTPTIAWQGSTVPACGATATWVTGCSSLLCGTNTETRRQECR